MLGFTLRTIQHMTPLTTAQSSLILVRHEFSHLFTYWIFFSFLVEMRNISTKVPLLPSFCSSLHILLPNSKDSTPFSK